MKKNQEKVASHIRQAIQAIGYDNAFVATKKLLLSALQSVEKIGTKRTLVEQARQLAEEKAKESSKKWWDAVMKNSLRDLQDDKDNSKKWWE